MPKLILTLFLASFVVNSQAAEIGKNKASASALPASAASTAKSVSKPRKIKIKENGKVKN